jgi:hypothetical protein
MSFKTGLRGRGATCRADKLCWECKVDGNVAAAAAGYRYGVQCGRRAAEVEYFCSGLLLEDAVL